MNRRYTVIVLFVVGLLALTACGAAEKSEAKPEERTPVSLQMAWTHEYFGAGLYAAEKNGHFADEGLAVTLVEGGFTENGYIEPIDVVVDGSYDFGLTGADAMIRARAEGKPVVAIATIMQRSPSAIISLTGENLQRPQDLSEHTVQVADGGARNMYDALLEAQGIAADSVNTLPRTDFGVNPLLDGETDAILGWIINEGVAVQEAGETPYYILLSDYGIDTYNLVLFTTETTIQERPEVVEKFLRAMLDGYRDAIADPAQATEYILEYNSSLDAEGQRRRLDAMIPLMNIPGQDLGRMDEQIWEVTQEFMLKGGSISAPVDVQSVYSPAFLDKIYAE